MHVFLMTLKRNSKEFAEFLSICILKQTFPERDSRSAGSLRKQIVPASRDSRSENACISNKNGAGFYEMLAIPLHFACENKRFDNVDIRMWKCHETHGSRVIFLGRPCPGGALIFDQRQNHQEGILAPFLVVLPLVKD